MTLRNNFECDGCGAIVAIDASHGWQQIWPTINEDQRERLHLCAECTKVALLLLRGRSAPAARIVGLPG